MSNAIGPNRKEELNWRRTYGIIVGTAKGLSYLHDDPQNCIIHRDIKADNILIDHKWVPKIADFGISRLFDKDQTHVYTGAVGTWYAFQPFTIYLYTEGGGRERGLSVCGSL